MRKIYKQIFVLITLSSISINSQATTCLLEPTNNNYGSNKLHTNYLVKYRPLTTPVPGGRFLVSDTRILNNDGSMTKTPTQNVPQLYEKITEPTFNHIFAKNSKNINGMFYMWKLVSNADNANKTNLFLALNNEVKLLAGKLATNEYGTKYYNAKITAVDDHIKVMNSLMKGLEIKNFDELCIKLGSGVCELYNEGKKGVGQAIVIANQSAVNDDALCKTMTTNMSALFMWNPAFGFLSPLAVTRSWDPADSFDSWVYDLITVNNDEKKAIKDLELFMSQNPQLNQNNGNKVAELMTKVINSQLSKGSILATRYEYMSSDKWEYVSTLDKNNKAIYKFCPSVRALAGHCFDGVNI
ncbi:MAG: hypothetical protein PHC75_00990 [Burkholderiales bacterium]|nr:hypothetical protein [Burkholderiales bacterium]